MINRVLVVGFGSIGKRHLRLAREMLPHAEIGVLRHRKSDVVPEFADYSFNTVFEALAFSPKVAVIANPATFHISVALLFAKAGVHLLIEKPLSNNLNGIKSLIDICLKQGIVLATGYNLRFMSSLKNFKSIIDEGLIGDVWSVHAEAGQYLKYWRQDTDYRKSVSAQSILGGGVLLELSHELDYLRWIFGEIEWVQATLSTQSDLEIDVEDSMHLIMGFFSKSRSKQLIGNLNLDFIRHDSTRSCTAIGKKGTLRWDGIKGKVELFTSDNKEWQAVYNKLPGIDESYIDEWRNFISSVEMNSKPEVSGEDGQKVVQIVESIRQAAKSCCRVNIPYSQSTKL
jgi:predicted dehydrogenase